MKLLPILFLCALTLQVNAHGPLEENITIKKDNASLEVVFREIEKQSPYRFFFNETLMKMAQPVSINVEKATLKEALEACFRVQKELTYAIVERTVIVKRREAIERATGGAVRNFERLAELRGMVTSEHGPVAGATITVRGTEKSTTTNNAGEFVLFEVDDRAVLVVSSVSHFEQEIRLNGKAIVNIILAEKVSDLDEQIVVAYNTNTKKNAVGAITVVKGEQIQNLPYRSVDKMLQGLVPGLLVKQGTGTPGGGVASIVLRGIATGGVPIGGNTARNPLIVVDGIPVFQDAPQLFVNAVAENNPMSQLNPSDIESISVLKDAAAIALYGSKASNGVILITTKRGKAGRTIFNFRHQSDFSSRLKTNQSMLNQQEYLNLLFETYRNTDPTIWTDEAILDDLKTKFPTKADGSFYEEANWMDELYRRNAATIANEISMSGGNDRNNYYLNIEYTKQNGIEKSTGFDRKSLRFNFENKASDWLKLGVRTSLSYTIQNFGSTLTEQAISRMSPLNPIRDENGEYIYNMAWGVGSSYDLGSSVLFSNPAAVQELNINRNVSYRGLSKFYAEFKFLKNFTFTPAVGVDFSLTEYKVKIHPKLTSDGFATGVGSIGKADLRNANIINTNILRYDKAFSSKHRLNVLAGHEAQIQTYNRISVGYQNLSENPVAEELSGTLTSGAGTSTKQTMLSFFGQANYGFDQKYFLTASARTDGSSLFGENKRFGTHWSTGAGWVISEESFLKNSSGWLNYLKLRGSLGSAGNSAAIFHTLRLNRLILIPAFGGAALFPDVGATPNPGIQWEKTFTWDAGLELQMANNRITIEADIYKRKTSKLIGTIRLPLATGFAQMKTNVGDLENSGFEFSISADLIRTKNFRWNLSGNWSMNKNKLVKSSYPIETAYGENEVFSSTIVANGEGENYNSFYLARWAGVDPASGLPQWYDSTGKISSDYMAAKQSFVGKPQPDGFGSVSTSISWKNIELSAMFQYQYGFQVYHPYLVDDGLDPFINQGKAALNRWQKPGDVATNPRRLLFGNIGGVADGGYYNSTRYLFDGDFVRLSNVTLSYKLPKNLIDRMHLQSCQVFVQGNNLATWTKYSGRQDPENVDAIGVAAAIYPLQRSFSFGLNLSF